MADEREILQANWHQASNEAIYWNQMANNNNSEITKQLLTVAAILIPLTGTVIIAPENIHLNGVLSTLLSGSLIFLFVSMIFGFIDIHMGARFFRQYTNYNASRASIYHKHLFTRKNSDEAEAEIANLEQPPQSSENMFGWFQIGSLVVGIVLIIGVIIPLFYLH